MRCLHARSFAAAVLAAALCACAAHTPAPDEFFDATTGATLSVAHEPLLFSCANSMSVETSAYISVTAAQIDRSGKAQTYLVAYLWPNLPESLCHLSRSAFAQNLEFVADGTLIHLEPAGQVPPELGNASRLLAPLAANFERAVYLTDLKQIESIGKSRELKLRIGVDANSFELWGDPRASWRELVGHMQTQY
jgi:hypothetical protein